MSIAKYVCQHMLKKKPICAVSGEFGRIDTMIPWQIDH